MATIQGVYVALFGRPADPIGLSYWSGVTNDGKDLSKIIDLSETPEYMDRFEGQTYTQVVNSIYMSLFNRPAEASGLTFFVNGLISGKFNINDIAIRILDAAQKSDKTIVDLKVAAADAFTKALDTGPEITQYSGNDAAAVGRDFLTGVTSAAPSAEEVDAAVASLGTTSSGTVLTLDADVLSGNVFTAGLQIQNGQNNETLSSNDQLTGTGTNPTLNAEVSGYAHTISPASLEGIETVNLTVSPLTALTVGGTAAGLVTLNAANADAIKNVSVTANNLTGSAVSLINVATAIETLNLSQNTGNVTLNSLAAALAGDEDSVAVNLDQVTGGNLRLLANTGDNGYETVALTSGGNSANTLGNLFVTGGDNSINPTQVTIAGSQNLTIDDGNIINVDATGFTGELRLFDVGSGDATLVGGGNDDLFDFSAGNFNATDVVDGGAGTDILHVQAAADAEAIAAANANITAIETLTLHNAGTANATLRADLLGTSINTIVFQDSTANGNYTVRMNAGANTITVGNQDAPAAVGFGQGGTVALEANGTATTDSLVLNLNGDDIDDTVAETSDITAGALNLNSNGRAIESLTINTSNATTNHTVGAITLPTTAGVTDTINITGTSSLTIDGVVTAERVDASGLTGNAGLTMSLSAASTNPMFIVGSDGADVLAGSAGVDTISDGAGNDTIAAGAGADSITLTAGDDRVVFDNAAATAALTSANFDVVTGFTVGASATVGDRVVIDVGTGSVGLPGVLALDDGAGTALAGGAETAVSAINMAANTSPPAATATDTFIKLTTGVATTATTTAQQAFDTAIGSGTVTTAAGNVMLSSFYDTTNGRAVLLSVDTSGGTDGDFEAADTVSVLGMIDMSAADYANFGANNIFFA